MKSKQVSAPFVICLPYGEIRQIQYDVAWSPTGFSTLHPLLPLLFIIAHNSCLSHDGFNFLYNEPMQIY